MRYVIVSIYPADCGSGIGNYTSVAARELRRRGVEVHVIENRDLMPHDEFRAHVAAEVARRFDPRDTVIEAPETWSPTRLLESGWRVHIRLHCPGAVLSFANGQPIDLDRFAGELAVARRASIVSSPSRALRDLLLPYLDARRVRVYPNPPPFDAVPSVPAEKDIDLLFMARFNGVKGAEHLQWLLPALPAERRVALLGRHPEQFRMPPGVRAKVNLNGFDPTAARFDLLRRARALLMLSRFENGPMTVREALAHGTPVVGWEAGGMGEAAGPPLVNLVPWGDRRASFPRSRRWCAGRFRRRPPSPKRQHACGGVSRKAWHRSCGRLPATPRGMRSPNQRRGERGAARQVFPVSTNFVTSCGVHRSRSRQRNDGRAAGSAGFASRRPIGQAMACRR